MAGSFEADIAAMIQEIESPEEQARRFALYAAEEIEDARRINRAAFGRDVPYTVAIDGREGAALAAVRPNSVVVATWRLVEEALEWIGRALVEESPVRSGRYAQSHLLFVNSIEHDPGDPIPAGATDFVFLNSQPYARKIEGSNNRPPLSAQAPDGVYQAVATMAARRFQDIANIAFGYEATAKAPARSTRAERVSERDSRQPAIFVRPL